MPISRGFVLITAMIFLLVLTLVAVIAVKGSGLELRMSANNAMHTEAFENSEGPRVIVGRLIDRLGFHAETGWPDDIGGDTPDDQFNYTIPDRVEILDKDGEEGGTPVNWFIDLQESDFLYEPFKTVSDPVVKSRARYSVDNIAASGVFALPVRAEIDVKRARTAPKSGCDLSSGGYDGVSSRTCADYIFLVTSRGEDSSQATDYETSSMYRYVPR